MGGGVSDSVETGGLGLVLGRGGEGAYNGVDTGHLLPDHEHDADDGALAVAGDCPHLLEQRLGGGVADQPLLVCELLGHFPELVLQVGVVRGQAKQGRQRTEIEYGCTRSKAALPSQPAKDRGRRLPVVLRRGPAGALGHHEHEDNEEAVMKRANVSNSLKAPRGYSMVGLTYTAGSACRASGTA